MLSTRASRIVVVPVCPCSDSSPASASPRASANSWYTAQLSAPVSTTKSNGPPPFTVTGET